MRLRVPLLLVAMFVVSGACSARGPDSSSPTSVLPVVDSLATDDGLLAPTEATVAAPSAGANGQPLSDAEFAAHVGRFPIVPGTGRVLYRDLLTDFGPVGLFTGREIELQNSEPMYCVYDAEGNSDCFADADDFDAWMEFGIEYSTRCDDPVAQLLTIWGLDDSVSQVVVRFDDDAELRATPNTDIVQMAWKGIRVIDEITLDGADTAQNAEPNSHEFVRSQTASGSDFDRSQFETLCTDRTSN